MVLHSLSWPENPAPLKIVQGRGLIRGLRLSFFYSCACRRRRRHRRRRRSLWPAAVVSVYQARCFPMTQQVWSLKQCNGPRSASRKNSQNKNRNKLTGDGFSKTGGLKYSLWSQSINTLCTCKMIAVTFKSLKCFSNKVSIIGGNKNGYFGCDIGVLGLSL